VVNDCFNFLAINMMKKKKEFSFFVFRSCIRRNIRQIIINHRWLQEKIQQIEFFGIECNIYIPMIIPYLNMRQVNLGKVYWEQWSRFLSFRIVYSINTSSSTSYASSITISTWNSFSVSTTILNKWCRWDFNTSPTTQSRRSRVSIRYLITSFNIFSRM
jgi:hypothetical protein